MSLFISTPPSQREDAQAQRPASDQEGIERRNAPYLCLSASHERASAYMLRTLAFLFGLIGQNNGKKITSASAQPHPRSLAGAASQDGFGTIRRCRSGSLEDAGLHDWPFFCLLFLLPVPENNPEPIVPKLARKRTLGLDSIKGETS